MKTEQEYAEMLIEQYSNILGKSDTIEYEIQCAINDVQNTIEALDEIWVSHRDDDNITETKQYYNNVLNILKEKV